MKLCQTIGVILMLLSFKYENTEDYNNLHWLTFYIGTGIAAFFSFLILCLEPTKNKLLVSFIYLKLFKISFNLLNF